MKKLFILFLLAFASLSVSAGGVPKLSWGSGYSSADAACAAAASGSVTYCSTVMASGTQANCMGTVNGQCTSKFQYAQVYSTNKCPTEYPVTGPDGLCYKKTPVQCPDGSYADSTAECPLPKCPVAAGGSVTWSQKTGHSASSSAGVSDPGSRVPYPNSSPQCGLTGTPNVEKCWSIPSDGGGKDFYCTYSGVSDGTGIPPGGGPIGTSDNSAGKPSENETTSADSRGNCPGGTAQAGFDSSGIPICVGPGLHPNNSSSSSTTTTPPQTTNNPDGSTTTTSSSSTTNADGSLTTTITTTVTGADGSVSTTKSTSTTNAANGGLGKDDANKDFCALHPELTICKNSTVSGQCDAVSCTGDAIQCSTLRAAAAMRCAQKKETDDLNASSIKALGDAALAGNDPMQSQIDAMKNGASVDMGSLDQSGWLGGGSCFADKSFSIQGRVITIPFSRACSALVVLRYAIMVVAMLVSFKIVSGAVIRE